MASEPKDKPKDDQIRPDPADSRYNEASTFGKKWNR
jgi:hypothetical protein